MFFWKSTRISAGQVKRICNAAFHGDVRVPPTNNLAEQALRPLVVLRKITLGHRRCNGGDRMAALMSVAETARRHGHRASQIF